MTPMSFDLFAQRFENGQASDIPVPEVLDVLRPFLIVGPEEDGFCRTRTPDGGEADFYLDDGRCGFGVNHFDRGETCELILRAASCHGLVLFGPGTPAMLTDARQLEHLPEPLVTGPAPPVLVTTGSELEAVIKPDADVYRICRKRLAAAAQARDGRQVGR